MTPSPAPVVLLHLWGVPTRRVPAAVGRMGTGPVVLRGAAGLTFHKLLGTGDGRTFTARDADPHHWGLLTVWAGAPFADAFAAGHPVLRSWRRIAEEELVVAMTPVASRGTWAGKEPFGRPVPRRGDGVDGPVASLTRARIRPSRAVRFWRAVPPVSADLHRVDGLRLAVGVGEAPVGLQGTFSLWRDAAALQEFAHRRGPHTDVVRRTPVEGWYAEELFARLRVRSVDGTFGGVAP